MSIRIYYDTENFRLRDSGRVRKFLDKVIRENNKVPGDLKFIFTGDESLKSINIEFLNHDYYTDVITFDFCEEDVLNGEIYISHERVAENAFNYKVSLKDETHRVMFHGILHLLGYKDGSEEEKLVMRKAEEECLKRFGGER